MDHQQPSYSQIASHSSQTNSFRYDRQVEIHRKFEQTMKRFEIFEELKK